MVDVSLRESILSKAPISSQRPGRPATNVQCSGLGTTENGHAVRPRCWKNPSTLTSYLCLVGCAAGAKLPVLRLACKALSTAHSASHCGQRRGHRGSCLGYVRTGGDVRGRLPNSRTQAGGMLPYRGTRPTQRSPRQLCRTGVSPRAPVKSTGKFSEAGPHPAVPSLAWALVWPLPACPSVEMNAASCGKRLALPAGCVYPAVPPSRGLPPGLAAAARAEPAASLVYLHDVLVLERGGLVDVLALEVPAAPQAGVLHPLRQVAVNLAGKLLDG